MTLEFDCSEDHEVWDGVETITYFSKTTEAPPGSGVEVEGTLWLAIRKDRLPADSILLDMDLTVELPVANLLDADNAAIVPKRKDILERADGTRWTAELIELVAMETQYRVHVKRGHK